MKRSIDPNVHHHGAALPEVNLPAMPGDDSLWFNNHQSAFLRHRPPNPFEIACYGMTPDQTLLVSRSGMILYLFGDPGAHGISNGHEMFACLVEKVNRAMNGELLED